MSDIEANIDYPEYDIEEVTNKKMFESLKNVEEKIKKLEKSFETGKILKDGVNLAIIGKPNVGKSSILNMLLREDRAIVTEIAGTTRDTIEEYININGIPIKIIDTAGIRESEDVVEKIGIEKSISISKILFATAAVENQSGKMGITLIVLAISTMLNAWYFFRAIICIYTPSSEKEKAKHFSLVYTIAMVAFIALNLFFGTCSDIVIKGIQTGLAMFS